MTEGMYLVVIYFAIIGLAGLYGFMFKSKNASESIFYCNVFIFVIIGLGGGILGAGSAIYFVFGDTPPTDDQWFGVKYWIVFSVLSLIYFLLTGNFERLKKELMGRGG